MDMHCCISTLSSGHCLSCLWWLTSWPCACKVLSSMYCVWASVGEAMMKLVPAAPEPCISHRKTWKRRGGYSSANCTAARLAPGLACLGAVTAVHCRTSWLVYGPGSGWGVRLGGRSYTRLESLYKTCWPRSPSPSASPILCRAPSSPQHNTTSHLTPHTSPALHHSPSETSTFRNIYQLPITSLQARLHPHTTALTALPTAFISALSVHATTRPLRHRHIHITTSTSTSTSLAPPRSTHTL